MFASSTSRSSSNSIRSQSIKVYAELVAALAIIYAAFTFLPTNYIVPILGTPTVWHEIGVVTVLGFVGLWLSQKTGFPTMWDEQVSNKQRFVVPAMVGTALGTILVLFNLIILQLPAGLHIPFPASIFYYTYASIETEILFRLFPIPILVWLVSVVLLKNRWQEEAFWVVTIALSFLEPLMQIGGLHQMGLLIHMRPGVIGLMFVLIYGTNFTLAGFLRKSGFLAPLTMRFAFYLAWHVIFGALA
jgi:hypothetical protein